MATREELIQATKEKYVKIIHAYMARPNTYDIVKYAKLNGASSFSNIEKWIAFAKEYLNEADYKAFLEKAAPFEALPAEEREEMKEKVALIATKVFQRKANMIDIAKEITPSMEKYMYMVKQLKFTYGMIAAHVFNKNLEFCDRTQAYSSEKLSRKITIMNLSKEDNKVLENIIAECGLLDNDITYHEAFLYAQRNNLISYKPQAGR